MSARQDMLAAAMMEMAPVNAWADVYSDDPLVAFTRWQDRLYAYGFRTRADFHAGIERTGTLHGDPIVMLLDLEALTATVPVVRWEPRESPCTWPGGCTGHAKPHGRIYGDGRLCDDHSLLTHDLEHEARGY